EIAYVPIEEMLEIEGFDEELVNNLRNRARDVILTEALATEELLKNVDEDFKNVESLSDNMLKDLVKNNIKTRDELAELSVDELMESTGVDNKTAEKIILSARAHWFANEDTKED